MKVQIEIDLGNDAMRTGADVAEVLRQLASRIEHDGKYRSRDAGNARSLRDVNGLKVGEWLLTD